MLKSILKRSLTLVSATLLCTTFSASARTVDELTHEYQIVYECASKFTDYTLQDVRLQITNDDSIYARAHTSSNLIQIHYLPAQLLTNAQLHFILAHELAHIIFEDHTQSRLREQRADRIAASILYHCGLDSSGYKSLLEASQDSMGVHDSNATRIKMLDAHVDEMDLAAGVK